MSREDGRVDLADDGASIVRSAILSAIAGYRQEGTDLLTDFDPDETEWGGGDPDWARAIAEDMADRWDS